MTVTLDLEQALNDLPSYIYCDVPDCMDRHFLNMNRDIHGRWSVGYISIPYGEGIDGLCFNDSITVTEAVDTMKRALIRHRNTSR